MEARLKPLDSVASFVKQEGALSRELAYDNSSIDDGSALDYVGLDDDDDDALPTWTDLLIGGAIIGAFLVVPRVKPFWHVRVKPTLVKVQAKMHGR